MMATKPETLFAMFLGELDEPVGAWSGRRSTYGGRLSLAGRSLRHLPAVTGPLSGQVVEAGTAFGESRTGIEYLSILVDHELYRAKHWGVPIHVMPVRGSAGEPHPPVDVEEEIGAPNDGAGEGTLDDARRLARNQAYVETTIPEAPQATGNLIIDARSFSGLTTQQLAEFAGVTERTIFGWRDNPSRIPEDIAMKLKGLQAVAATLVGGLGPAGVSLWLRAGLRPPLARLRAGEVAEVASHAEQYVDSPAT